MTSKLEIVADVQGNVESPQAELESAKPFPMHCLPHVLRQMAEGVADVAGVPGAMSAPLILAAASASLGRGLAVKSLRGLTTRGNLYVLLSKASGSGGSVAYKFAMSPIMGRQAEMRRAYNEQDRARLEAEREAAVAEGEDLRSKIKKADTSERECLIDSLSKARQKQQEAEDRLVTPLLAMSDATSEGAASLLSQHGECLLHADSDAGDALASILGKYAGERAQASESLWLKCFVGEEITVVRKNNATMYLEAPCLTVCFVATPERVRELFKQERLTEGGLLPRFMVCDPKAKPSRIDLAGARERRRIPAEASQPYEAAVWACLEAYRFKANGSPHVIDFESAALELIVDDWNRFAEIAEGESGRQLNPFESRETEKAIRLAVVLHAYEHICTEQKSEGTWSVCKMDGHQKSVSASTVERAIQIRDWFTKNLNEFLKPQREAAEEAKWDKVVGKIRDFPEGITARVLYSGHFVCQSKKEAEELLARWEIEGRVVRIPSEAGGPGRKVDRFKLAGTDRRRG